MTVSQLAKCCGLSRGTVIYYEAIGLLKAARRSPANYRCYADVDLRRFRQICSYRNAGLKLNDILALLECAEGDGDAVLKRRLLELDAEISAKREHQQAIVMLLQHKDSFRRTEMMTKEKWVGIMRAAGFTDDHMHRWHIEFERSAPEDHEEFLGSLHIPTEEIAKIREWSRRGLAPSSAD